MSTSKLKNIKIGIVCPYDYFRHGGVQEHIRAVAEELRKRGNDVKVITPTPPSGENLDPENVITLGKSSLINAPGTSFEVSASASSAAIDAMFEREKFDIVHYHEPMIPLLSGQILARSPSVNVATFHAYQPDDFINKSIDLIYLPYHRNRSKYINYITAVSDAAAIFVRKATSEDIKIVPNGIQLDKYNRSTTPYYDEFNDDKKTILYVGRLEKRKGVEYLLRAYELLKEENDNIRLVIAGDGPKMRSLQTYVDQYAVEDVHFLGFVSEAVKLSLLKTCDLFCSPALYGESFGIVLLEAMAMNTPIVAGDNPGYASVLKERGKLGLVNPKQINDFARRLDLMLSDDGLRKMMTDWSSEYVKQFDYKNVTDEYLKIYEKLLV